MTAGIITILLSVFRMAVIPVQFEDKIFSADETEIQHEIARAEEYFNAQLSVLCPGGGHSVEFVMAPKVTVSRELSYYGANYTDRRDVLLHEAVREACRLSRNSVDFRQFDNDGDGYVDNVHIVAAGPGEPDSGNAENIWPQQSRLDKHGSVLNIGGKNINSYTVSAEDSKAGTICHELGHCLGLYDLYDTDGGGSEGFSAGLRQTSLMDNGCNNDSGNTPPNFSALDLEIMNINRSIAEGTALEPHKISKGSHTLKPLGEGGSYLRLDSHGSGEFFLLECRKAAGWDRFIGGSGLVVYHIDMSSEDAGYSDIFERELSAAERWQNNQVNNNPGHECARALTGPDDDGSAKAIFFPGNGYSGIGQAGGPQFRYWNGKSSTLAITGIAMNPDGSVTFNVLEPITISVSGIHQDSATLQWDTDIREEEIDSYGICWTDGSNSHSAMAPAGSRSYMIDRLGTRCECSATVTIRLKDGTEYHDTVEFTTKFYKKGSYPYIYMGGNSTLPGRNKDGSFNKGSMIPLKVYNAPEAAECEWRFNGRTVTSDAGGFFKLEESGTLEALLLFNDGHRETIRKEIVIR